MNYQLILTCILFTFCAVDSGYAINSEQVNQQSQMADQPAPSFDSSEDKILEIAIQNARMALKSKQFEKALTFANKALARTQTHFQLQSESRIRVHQLFADIYSQQKNYAAAEKHLQQAYTILRIMFGERHEKTIHHRLMLGQLYEKWGITEKAAKVYQALNIIYQDIYGNKHEKSLSIVSRQAKLFFENKQYQKARPFASQAVKIATSIYGKKSIRIRDSLIMAGQTYFYCKSYTRAFKVFDRARILVQNRAPSDAQLKIYQYLAQIHQLQKRFQDAENMYKKVIALSRNIYGENNKSQLESYEKLVEIYQIQGKFDAVKNKRIKMIQLMVDIYGPDHPKTTSSQVALANMLFEKKDYNAAAVLYENIMQSNQKPQFLDLTSRLAKTYIAQSRFHEAENLLRENLTYQESLLDTTRENLQQLANLFKMQNNCSKAIPLMDQTFRLNEATLGPTHPETLSSLSSLIGCLTEENLNNQALELLRRIEKPLFQAQLKQLQSSEMKQLNKNDVINSHTFCHAVFTLAREMNHPEVTHYVADVMLRWQYLNHFPGAGNKELSGYYDINTLFQTRMVNLPYRLPRNSAFIHLYPYEKIDFSNAQPTETRWMAILILSEQYHKNIFCADLGKMHQVRQIVNQLSTEKQPERIKQSEKRLYQELFSSFDQYLKTVQSVYISTNGYGHMIPYPRLRLPDDRFWIERQPVCRVFSALDFRKGTTQVYTGTLLALGQINYDAFIAETQSINEEMAKISTPKNHIPLPQSHQISYRYRPYPDESLFIEEIINIYRVSRNKPPVFWANNDANEPALKNLQMPPRILHFSTDCFYLNTPDIPIRIRGGLALAGANQGFLRQAGPEGQDGLLLDAEILSLNLQNTELVCLSKKCDAYKNGTHFSAFFQMAVSFHMAGCRFVLSPSRQMTYSESSQFLARYYNNWLRQSISNPSKALRKTQMQSIAENVPARIWGSFVMMGF